MFHGKHASLAKSITRAAGIAGLVTASVATIWAQRPYDPRYDGSPYPSSGDPRYDQRGYDQRGYDPRYDNGGYGNRGYDPRYDNRSYDRYGYRGYDPAQIQTRRASYMRGGNYDNGKCTVEVVVDGTADIEIRGDVATMRNLNGQPPEWRRFQCTGPLPANPVNFRFAGVDGRGGQYLIRDPRQSGSAVIRIDDPDRGREGYTFDIFWQGASGGYRDDGSQRGGPYPDGSPYPGRYPQPYPQGPYYDRR